MMQDTKHNTSGKVWRVMVVDDHSIIRHGIATLLANQSDMKICGEAESFEQALEVLDKARPDVMLVDITLKDRSGLDLIREVREFNDKIRILVLSIHDESVYAERVLRAGAQGYVMKEKADDDIVEAIRTVARNKTYVSKEVSLQMVHQYIDGPAEDSEGTGINSLTDRELEVFEHIGRGLTTKRIAEKLDLSTRTVEVHRAHIKKKLGCEDAAQVVREAVRWVEK